MLDTFCRYDIVYKQAIATEDMFLGMSNRTPSTSSCEDMVVSNDAKLLLSKLNDFGSFEYLW